MALVASSSSASFTSTSSNDDGGSSKRKFMFPYQLHRMLEDAEVFGFDHVVSFVPGTSLFKVYNSKKFENVILGRYLPTQTRYKSFLRQLNMYGFSRVIGGAYGHPLFVRGEEKLCDHMTRKHKRASNGSGGGSPAVENCDNQQQANKFTIDTTKQDVADPKFTSLLMSMSSLPGMDSLFEPNRLFTDDDDVVEGNESSSARRPQELEMIFQARTRAKQQQQQQNVAGVTTTDSTYEDYDYEVVAATTTTSASALAHSSAAAAHARRASFEMSLDLAAELCWVLETFD